MTQAVTAGQFISIVCLGLGPVNNTPPTGRAHAGWQIRQPLAPVSVLFNGVSVPASFAGLAPGLIGAYQVHVQIPNNAPTGTAVPISIGVGGLVSNTVTIRDPVTEAQCGLKAASKFPL